MSCPKCQGDTWKAASLVHIEGMTNVNTKSSTGGIGIDTNGVGIGSATTETKGTIQSEVSILASPPNNPGSNQAGKVFAVIVFGLLMVTNAHLYLAFVVIIASPFFWFYSGYKSKYEKLHQAKVKKYRNDLTCWESTRMCQRCGNLYVCAT